MTATLTLYHFPNACSQVCLCALEETGLEFRLELIDLATNQQASNEYAIVSPLGKVPALRAEGTIITENAAILTYIAALCPDARLFPVATSPLELAERQSGLSFCGGTLHPIVRGIAAPHRLTDGEVEPVYSRATALAEKNFAFAERRIAERGWWLGEWSLIDFYLNWALQTARRGGYDLARFPQLEGLHDRLMNRPAFARVMDMEEKSISTLADRGAP
ncbi:MAG: gst [Sphingomonadales bacterium]|nr:gst [Sphingomonadales bacterium]